MCSLCRREVHQDGPPLKPDAEPGFRQVTWTHCEDKSPRCAGASSINPAGRENIVGRFCGADAGPSL